MLDYIREYIIGRRFGVGYPITNVIFMFSLVILLTDFKNVKKPPLRVVIDGVVCCLMLTLLEALYYWIFGSMQFNRICTAIVFALYATFRSKYDYRVRLVRSFTLMASIMVMLPISEPLGMWLSFSSDKAYMFTQFTTPMLILAMSMAVVWFLRHFSFDAGSIIGGRYVVLQVFISFMTIVIEVYVGLREKIGTDRVFHMTICLILWLINLVAYYMFYTIDISARDNIRLNALKQKAELEKEKFHATKLNYDELRSIRHEIKNHTFYMKALLDEGKIDEAREYLSDLSDGNAKYLESFDCGNYAVDVVMNHELAVAKEANVDIKTNILVPRELPFKDADVCSLLSNLLDNAIEAAQQSGADSPEVEISMLPRQEYLFIRVSNPVDMSLPEKRRMSLETTKLKHSELHGFGTRIIKNIAEKYKGSVKYSMSEGIFTTDVMLEMP